MDQTTEKHLYSETAVLVAYCAHYIQQPPRINHFLDIVLICGVVIDKGNKPLEKTELNADAEQDREFVERIWGVVSEVIHARVSREITERVSEDPFEESLGQYVEHMSENDVVVTTDFITIVTINMMNAITTLPLNQRSAMPKSGKYICGLLKIV